MPIKLGELEFYKTGEACRLAGTSRNTYLRWVKNGVLKDVGQWDRRGWRLFTDDDVARLKAEVNMMIEIRGRHAGDDRNRIPRTTADRC